MISLINTRSHWTDVIEQNHFPDGTLLIMRILPSLKNYINLVIYLFLSWEFQRVRFFPSGFQIM